MILLSMRNYKKAEIMFLRNTKYAHLANLLTKITNSHKYKIGINAIIDFSLFFHEQIETRLLVSGRSPECSDCLLRFMEQQ